MPMICRVASSRPPRCRAAASISLTALRRSPTRTARAPASRRRSQDPDRPMMPSTIAVVADGCWAAAVGLAVPVGRLLAAAEGCCVRRLLGGCWPSHPPTVAVVNVVDRDHDDDHDGDDREDQQDGADDAEDEAGEGQAAAAELALGPRRCGSATPCPGPARRRGEQADAVARTTSTRATMPVIIEAEARGRRSAASRRGTAAGRSPAAGSPAAGYAAAGTAAAVRLLPYGGWRLPYGGAGGGGAPYGWCVGGVPGSCSPVRVLGAGRHGGHPVRLASASQRVDVRERRGAEVVGCPRGAHRHPGQLGELRVGELVGGAHRGVLAGQPRAEEQRVVGAERDGRAGGEQRSAAAPRSGRSRRRARRWRPGRPRGRPRPRRSGPGAPGPRRPGRRGRAGPRRSESRQTRMCSGPAQLAAVRHQQQPGRARRCGRRTRSRRCCRGARRWRARSRPRRGRRTARRAGPGCGRRAGAGSGWRRSPRPSRGRSPAEASRTASSTRSVNAVIPPKRAPYPLGSTWISSQRPPSRTSSSAASRTSRRTSSSVRSTDRATS